MTNIKDFWDYIFDNQIKKDLDVEKISKDQQSERLADKKAKLKKKLNEKFAAYLDNDLFKNYILENNPEMANILYPDESKKSVSHNVQFNEEEDEEWEDEEEKEIVGEFHQLNQKYNFIEATDKNIEFYINIYKLVKFIAENIEQNADPLQISLQSYKLLSIWGFNLVEIDNFIKNFYLDNQSPLHDALIFALPEKTSNIQQWRNLIKKHGPKIFIYFSRAEEIEIKLDGKAPKDIEEAAEISSQLSYQRALENPKLAKIFNEYNIPEKVFEKVLSIELNRTVNQDNLPNLHLNGAELGEEYKGYHLCKLPKSDVRGYILGEITACCQSVNNYAEECAIDGMTRENDGFYVLVKYLNNEAKQKASPFLENGEIDYRSFKIMGQAYAWRSIHGNLVFDSWENLDQLDDDKLVPLLKDFATKIVKEYEIGRVTIGSSGKTPEKLKCDNPYNEVVLEGHSYDSSSQWLLATSDVLEQQNKALEVPIYSLKFAEELAHNQLLLKKIKDLQEAGIPLEALQYLSSDLALQIYRKFKQCDPEWLYILAEEDVSILKSITSYAAFQIYIEQNITPENLLEIVSKNKVLLAFITSDQALRIIQLFPTLSLKSLLDFAKLDIEILRVLISPQSIRTYLLLQKQVTPQHLLEISGNNKDIIEALTSEVAQSIYINCHLDPSSLWYIAEKRAETLKALLQGNEEFYKRFPMVDLRKIVLFTNNNSELLGAIIQGRYLYQAFLDITPENLIEIPELNIEVIRKMNTWEVLNFARLFPKITFHQLLQAANNNINTVALLVNSNIYHKFPTHTPFRLIEITKGNFELLNSILPQGYFDFYRSFANLTPEKLIEICDSNVEIIQELTDAKNQSKLSFYKDILEDLPKLAEFNYEILQKLLQDSAISTIQELYQYARNIHKRELVRIYQKNPNILKDLGLHYPHQQTSFEQHNEFSLEEILRISDGDKKIIDLMHNSQLYELCKTYSIPPEQLIELIRVDDKIISPLYNAKEFYSHFQVGPIELANLADRQVNVIANLSDYQAISLYKELPSITPEILSFLFLNYPEKAQLIFSRDVIIYCKNHPTLPLVKLFKAIIIFGMFAFRQSLSLENLEDLLNSIELIKDDKNFLKVISEALANRFFPNNSKYSLSELVQLSKGNHEIFAKLIGSSDFFCKYSDFSPTDIIELANQDPQIISLLTEPNAILLYEKYHITPQDLLAISAGKQDVLSYLTASVQHPFSDIGPSVLMQLSEGDSQLLKLMVSRGIILIGEKFSVTLQELMATIEKNKKEILEVLCNYYDYNWHSKIKDIELKKLLEICNYNGSILKLVFSYDAVRLFESYPELQLEEFVEIFADKPELFKDITSILGYSIKSFLSQYSQISLKDIVKLSNYNKDNLSKVIDSYAQEFYKRYNTIDIKKLITIYQAIDGDIVHLLRTLKLNPEQLFDEHKGDKNLIKASLYIQLNKLNEAFPDLSPAYLLNMFNNNPDPIRRLTTKELLTLTKIKVDLLPMITEAYARRFYQESSITIEESLKAASNDPDTLRMILSEDARRLYKSLDIKPNRLALLSKPKNDMKEIIETLKKADKDVGLILISFAASKLYSRGTIDLCSLSALTSDKAVLLSLVSYKALKIYEHNPKITPLSLHQRSQDHNNLEEIISGLYNETQKSDEEQNTKQNLEAILPLEIRERHWQEQVAAKTIQNVSRGYQARKWVEQLETKRENMQAKEI